MALGLVKLPLSLEDSCLAWLVSDLEHYPPELLALLPLRLRYRLLANVPVLDLCQLEHTSVAESIDLESIWELKCTPWGEEGAAMKQRATNVVRYIDLSSLSWRDRYLHAVANTILNNSLVHCQRFLGQGASNTRIYFSHSNYYAVVADWLISLKGYQFLNEGGDLQSGYDWQSLASSFLFFEAEYGSRYDRLTPPRYVPYKSGHSTRLSDEELLTLLLRNCHFKPKYLFILDLLVDLRFSVSELLLQSEACDILKDFLNELEEVQLHVPDNLPNLPVVLFQSMLSGTSPCTKLRTLQVLFQHVYFSGISVHDKEEFQKCMLRIITNIIKQQYYMETIDLKFIGQFRDTVLESGDFTALAAALTSFVARPHFRTLDLHSFEAPADAVTDTLCAFLVSPCSHQQTLKLPQLTTQPSSRQLHPATPCPAGAMSVPDSGVEYKELYLFQHLAVNESYVQICKTFFAFPRIRLRFLDVGCVPTITHNYVNTLHMAAQHPDIQVKSLSIRLQCGIEEVLPTLHNDMGALLQIPTLTSLSLPLMPRHAGNSFLPILAQELPKRRHLAAIKKLDLGRSNFLELPAEEVEHLFRSIFSLPHLSQLTLKLTYSVVNFHHYKLIHRLWTEYSSGERLKKLVLGSVVLMTEEEYTDESSVTGIMPLLDSMAQSTSVIDYLGQLSGVKIRLMVAKLKTSD